MGFCERVTDRYNYKILALITPLIALLLLPAALNVRMGIDFTGGTEIQILTERDTTAAQFQSALMNCSNRVEANLQELEGKTSVILRSKDEITKECLDTELATIGFTPEELAKITPSTYKPELGQSLLGKGVNILIISGILMTIVVFMAFRTLTPSLAVVQSALFDPMIALGVLSLLGFELNLAGFAAMLMLIGYSVDTDILLTSKALNQTTKPFNERVNPAVITGMTMTLAAIAAMASVFAVSFFIHMSVLVQISAVLITGLVADLGSTWFTNVGIIKWYCEKKKHTTSRFKFSLFRS